jgi:hypothetical protein
VGKTSRDRRVICSVTAPGTWFLGIILNELRPVSEKLPITISVFHRYTYDIALNNAMTSIQMDSEEDNTKTHRLCNRGIGAFTGGKRLLLMYIDRESTGYHLKRTQLLELGCAPREQSPMYLGSEP